MTKKTGLGSVEGLVASLILNYF